MAFVLKVPANAESIWISAFITALIMAPVAPGDWKGIGGLAIAAGAGIAAKFILAINRKHIFNPVAFGVVASTYIVDAPPTWWVGGSDWMRTLPRFISADRIFKSRNSRRAMTRAATSASRKLWARSAS